MEKYEQELSPAFKSIRGLGVREWARMSRLGIILIFPFWNKVLETAGTLLL